ncbi:MAG: hypothetical protein AB1505_06115 [Candidatus Latescibacterota bacterium]
MAVISSERSLSQQPYLLCLRSDLSLRLPADLDNEDIDVVELGDSVVLDYLCLSAQVYNLTGSEGKALAQVAAAAYRRWLEPELRVVGSRASHLAKPVDQDTEVRLYDWTCRALRWREAGPAPLGAPCRCRSRPVNITFEPDMQPAGTAETLAVGGRAVSLSSDAVALATGLGVRGCLDTAGALATTFLTGLRDAAFITARDPEVGDRWIALEVTLEGHVPAVLDQLDAFTDAWVARVPWPQRDAVRLRYQMAVE